MTTGDVWRRAVNRLEIRVGLAIAAARREPKTADCAGGGVREDVAIEVFRHQHVEAADMSTALGETHAMNKVVQTAKKHGVSANELWREATWSSSPRDIEAEVSGEADERAAERGIPDDLRGSNAVLDAREKDKRDAIEKLPKKQKDDVAEGRIKMVQAPKGGATSDVNGKFYKGGHWMPVHGLSAGKEKPFDKSKPEANSDGSTPVANASGKAPSARQLSPEMVAAERDRQRDQQRWDKLKRGPLADRKSTRLNSSHRT